jgi:glycosyltransferase involved in cell wall biosynthesis
VNSLGPEDFSVVISQCTKDDLCNLRPDIDPARVFVTYLAASDTFKPCSDAEQLKLVRKKYSLGDAPYFLSLSTLEPRKNITHTIRSFAKLVIEERLHDLNLVLAGGKGWLYEQIFQEISGLDEVKDRIIVTGYIDDNDLPALYSGALAFVYPSLYEGFGLPPLEAMQCGVPVITSNTSALPEVVGKAGIMLDPHDVDGMCQAMLNLYRNSYTRNSLASQGLARAKEFSWARCTKDTVAAYRTALAA